MSARRNRTEKASRLASTALLRQASPPLVAHVFLAQRSGVLENSSHRYASLISFGSELSMSQSAQSFPPLPLPPGAESEDRPGSPPASELRVETGSKDLVRRESEVPESYIRELRASWVEADSCPESEAFTSQPPPLPRLHPFLNPQCPLEELPVPRPPHVSVLRWWLAAITCSP